MCLRETLPPPPSFFSSRAGRRTTIIITIIHHFRPFAFTFILEKGFGTRKTTPRLTHTTGHGQIYHRSSPSSPFYFYHLANNPVYFSIFCVIFCITANLPLVFSSLETSEKRLNFGSPIFRDFSGLFFPHFRPEKKPILDPGKKAILDPGKKSILDPGKKSILDPGKKGHGSPLNFFDKGKQIFACITLSFHDRMFWIQKCEWMMNV